ncbi:unnamed protein product [Moneuplotes crassus]|uniref:Leo1-like protein n=1 Tax=Euplotes crassus TaxID=5936 RepID=A0AAD1XVZ3_EUPCR|nr:unnamed protein product [Moneuplotes crassus]
MENPKINKKVPRDATVGLDGDCFEMKMPNIVKIQSKPFDPATYEPEKSIKYKNQHGQEKEKNFNLLNVIRWRYTDQTSEPFVETPSVVEMRESMGYKSRYPSKQIETNTKVVEWSDGTFSLIVGDETFDLNFSKSSNCHVYLKTDDLLVHKNQVERKCLVKPSKMSKRAMKSILKNVNEKAKQMHSVEKTFSMVDDPKFKKGRLMEKKEEKEKTTRKRSRRDYLNYDLGFDD